MQQRPDQIETPRRGAHGLYLPDLDGAAELLLQAPDHWAEWRVVFTPGSGQPEEFIDSSMAQIRSAPDGWVEIDRERRLSTFHLPTEPTTEQIAQPFLGSTAVVAAHWNDLHCFHAGAFVADGKAWAILGSKGMGKSSLLAALSLRGLQILTDDLLVVSERFDGLAGPRSIDLRQEAASALGVGRPLGVVGARERWRVQLDKVPPEVPLGGWVCLEWGDLEIGSVGSEQRIEVLLGSLALRVQPHAPKAISRLMDLIALPMCRLSRPRDFDEIDQTAERLVAHLATKD